MSPGETPADCGRDARAPSNDLWRVFDPSFDSTLEMWFFTDVTKFTNSGTTPLKSIASASNAATAPRSNPATTKYAEHSSFNFDAKRYGLFLRMQ